MLALAPFFTWAEVDVIESQLWGSESGSRSPETHGQLYWLPQAVTSFRRLVPPDCFGPRHQRRP